MFRSWIGRLLIVVCTVPLTCGCHQYPSNFIDDLPDSSMITTASRERARASEVMQVQRKRGFEVIRIDAQDGTVVHGPLYMEDPVEMYGSADGQFAFTKIDHYLYPYSIGRYFVNLVLMPLSMIVDPPHAVVCSDGIERRSRGSWLPQPYDAERCIGTAELPDIHEAWTFHE